MDKKMTRAQAGQRGGEKTAQTHGKNFYEEIGHKGGEKTAQTHDKNFYKENGQKGGQKNCSNPW
ncbi:general stress protein (plasmid) [Melissococcus plutonius DAT561]|nr:general stress protein [Melissococcus plutonius DAT561]